jgi:hypothetical protein
MARESTEGATVERIQTTAPSARVDPKEQRKPTAAVNPLYPR